MRLAYVCADAGVPVFGSKGASVHVQEVIRALQRRGVTVELFAARTGKSRPGALERLTCHRLPRSSSRDPIQKERDAVSANGPLADVLRGAGPFDVVYERHALWSFAAMEHARADGIPGLLEVNAPLVDEQAVHRALFDRRLAEACAARAYGVAAATLAVSREVAHHVSQVAGQVRVHVVPNGVDPQRCAPWVAPRLPAPAGVRTLGFVGSLKPWHGIDVLLDAFDAVHTRMPQSRLLIVGDGPERARIERRLSEAGLRGSIVLTGAVRPDDVPGLLTSMDVAVAPYHEQRGFYFSPLKIFEYMATGLPTVASRIGQIADILEDDATGVLCPPGDSGALADSVVALFADAEKRRRIGAAARDRACRRHTWDAVAARILAIADDARAGAPAAGGVRA